MLTLMDASGVPTRDWVTTANAMMDAQVDSMAQLARMDRTEISAATAARKGAKPVISAQRAENMIMTAGELMGVVVNPRGGSNKQGTPEEETGNALLARELMAVEAAKQDEVKATQAIAAMPTMPDVAKMALAKQGPSMSKYMKNVLQVGKAMADRNLKRKCRTCC